MEETEEAAVDVLQSEPLAPRSSPEGDEKVFESPSGSKRKASKSAANKVVTAGQLPFVRKGGQNAVKMESTARTGRRMSGSTPSGDPFEGENLDDILKSLISTKKMDSAYQRIGRRLLVLESYIEVLRGGEGEEAFITRKEFIDFLQKSQDDVEAQIQAEHEARLAVEEERRLKEEAAAQQEDPVIIEVRETLKAQEEANECNLKQAMHDARRADQVKWTKVSMLEDQIEHLRFSLGEESKKRESSEAIFEKTVKQIQQSIKDLESRMQTFAVNEAHKMIGALLFNGASGAPADSSSEFRPAPSTTSRSIVPVEAEVLQEQATTSSVRPSSRPTEVQESMEIMMDRRRKAFAVARQGMTGSCTGPEEWRVAMLNLVDSGLLQPLRDQVERIHRDLVRQRDTFEKKNRAREKEIQDNVKQAQNTSVLLKEETDLRKQESFETSISFQKVYKVILESNEKMSDDVQTAMDRIRQLQMMMDGHTKQIDGHTKGIMKCCTNEEAAEISDSVQKCIEKEFFNTQMSEVKSMVLKQSERIGAVDLQVNMLVKNAGTSPTASSRRSKLKRMTRLKSKALNRDPSKGSLAASTAPGQDSMPSFFPGDEEGDDGEDEDDVSEGPSKSRSAASGQMALSAAGRDFAEDDDESYEESEYSEDPMEEQLREQVQGVCMGLVCLAHHVLRGPPQVGLSRQNRLLTEKDLLEELMSLRFWVTHRRIPPDWSMDRLTTVALRYSHPNPAEVHGPQPEMTTILQASKEGPSDRSRISYPLDPSVGSIGIAGVLGSSAGGGAGIMGGPLEDATLLPSAKLPLLEGCRVVPSLDKAATFGPGWRQPLSAREFRRSSGPPNVPLPPVS